MAFWIAIHSELPLESFGSVQLDNNCYLIGPGGGFLVSEGRHCFAKLARTMPATVADPNPDPWGNALPTRNAIGDLAGNSWWARDPLSGEQGERCRADIVTLLKTQHLLKSVLPDAHRWFTRMTRVVVPLPASDGGRFRSGTVAGVPGLVVVEITNSYLLTLEALIHETAHLYFHFCEIDRSFIKADHAELYASPLRRDPRPLRGIFLAYHALLYMCAFYQSWFDETQDRRCLEALENLRPLRRDAGATLVSAKEGLTKTGRLFLQKCKELAGDDKISESVA